LVGGGYISYENTIQFIHRDSLADRLDLINQKLEHLFSTLTGAESGQRGFIITNRPEYLEPYNSAVKDIDKQLGNLNMLLNGEPLNMLLNEMNVLKGLIKNSVRYDKKICCQDTIIYSSNQCHLCNHKLFVASIN
jgi:CHASE3 domain sensor protein